MKLNILNTEHYEYYQQKYRLSKLSAMVLASKNLEDDDIDDLFADATLSNPLQAKGMIAVVDRILKAKLKHEKVIVCGDYDADGICATTILLRALKRCDIEVGSYIPNRFKEGYGLNVNTVELAASKGYSLIITVDNGVKCFEALNKAKELNIDVIVTDHHDFDEEVPCDYLLHSFEMGDTFKYLCGAGIALEIARALKVACKDDVILAGVASISDVMIMKKETRKIVKLAIKYLNEGECLPIQKLANTVSKWSEESIAFQITPKLNVIGRLADRANANNMVKYLLSDNIQIINDFAKQVDDLNKVRKVMSEKMYQKAKSLIHQEYRFQLLFDDSFHEGISGIVAGRLCDELQLPVMIAAKHDCEFKGSIRSNGNVDLRNFFNDSKNILSGYGGHKKAAGIAFLIDHKQDIQDYVNEKMLDYCLDHEKSYDVIALNLYELQCQDILSLSQLSPYGEGFKEPLFYFKQIKVDQCIAMSNGAHTKWNVGNYEFVKWNCEEHLHFENHQCYDFIGTISVNHFRGKSKISVKVKEYWQSLK